MGWPQYTYLALIFMSVGMNLTKPGEPEDGRHNFWASSIASVFILWVLYMGGFFTGAAP